MSIFILSILVTVFAALGITLPIVGVSKITNTSPLTIIMLFGGIAYIFGLVFYITQHLMGVL